MTWDRPIPSVDSVSTSFWKAAASGKLLIQRCPACGNRQFYPRAVCVGCGADPSWEEASGRGTVHTFTTVRQNGARPFRDQVPYVVAIIELAEGPRMMGNITDCPLDEVHIGMPVEVHMVQAEPDVGVPFWRPAAADGPGTKGATA